MASKLTWTDQAIHDLEGIAIFIAGDSPHYAVDTTDRIVRAVERLREFPFVGRVVPEYRNPALRELLWRQYRIVYRVAADAVSVLAVVHGARLLPLDLDERET